MPDLQNSGVERGSVANLNLPTHTIHATIQEGDTVLADFTGENALRWPSVLSTLTPEQQDEIAGDVSIKILNWKAGL